MPAEHSREASHDPAGLVQEFTQAPESCQVSSMIARNRANKSFMEMCFTTTFMSAQGDQARRLPAWPSFDEKDFQIEASQARVTAVLATFEPNDLYRSHARTAGRRRMRTEARPDRSFRST
jgi:hypothetical protein